VWYVLKGKRLTSLTLGPGRAQSGSIKVLDEVILLLGNIQNVQQILVALMLLQQLSCDEIVAKAASNQLQDALFDLQKYLRLLYLFTIENEHIKQGLRAVDSLHEEETQIVEEDGLENGAQLQEFLQLVFQV